jgi:hypothetical protein
MTSWIEDKERAKISHGKDAHEICQHQMQGKEEV